MAVEQYQIELVSVGRHKQPALLILDESIDPPVLTLRTAEFEVTESADDYFEAFCRIREHLEPHGVMPVCFGACRNVFPSPMSRSMGDGLKAYRLTLGVPARTADLVEIFATGDAMDVVSVEEQQQFYERWLESLATGR